MVFDITCIVIDTTFRNVRSCMSMGMLPVSLAAIVTQPVLANSHSALISQMDLYACVTCWFCSLTTGQCWSVEPYCAGCPTPASAMPV